MRRPASVVALLAALVLALAPPWTLTHAAGPERQRLTPIIAELFVDPEAFAGKSIAIYGLVIEANRSGTEFLLQDVSQHPVKIVGNKKLKAKVGDQVIVSGTLRLDGKEPYVAARALVATRVLGGGGCC